MKKHVFLTGYMGSGKTTTAQALADILGAKLIDLDLEIERINTSKIAGIFDSNGESFFRKLESKALVSVIESHDPCVIALGGGTIISHDNLSFIKKIGLLIYLDTSINEIVSRLKNKIDNRPIIKKFTNDTDLYEFIETHINSRKDNYSKAHYSINNTLLSTKETSLKIIDYLKIYNN